MERNKRPIAGQIFSYAQLAELDLMDSPCLGIHVQHSYLNVQHAHDLDIGKVGEIMAATKWRYVRTTDEWIPVFECVTPDELNVAVDIVLATRYQRVEAFMTPKGGMWPADHISIDDGTTLVPVTLAQLISGEVELPSYPSFYNERQDDGTGDDEDDDDACDPDFDY